MKTILLFLLKGYRKYISPLSAPSCRFYPTCSCYAVEAVSSHGALRGGFFALKRVLKCHPYHKGGYDPVPPVKKAGSCSGDQISAEEL